MRKKCSYSEIPWYSVNLRIQSEFEKIQTRKTPNTDTFHPVDNLNKSCIFCEIEGQNIGFLVSYLPGSLLIRKLIISVFLLFVLCVKGWLQRGNCCNALKGSSLEVGEKPRFLTILYCYNSLLPFLLIIPGLSVMQSCLFVNPVCISFMFFFFSLFFLCLILSLS